MCVGLPESSDLDHDNHNHTNLDNNCEHNHNHTNVDNTYEHNHSHTNVDNNTTTSTTTTTPTSTTTTTTSSSSTAYPLKVSANGRYLVDQNDVPFLMIGDSPQSLTVNLSEAEADAFFADRQAAGFNLVWVNLLCATYTGGRADGSTYDGIVPFTTPNDLATPNDAFFTRVDHMLNLAAAHGLVVLLDPAETGSYLSVLNTNGVAKARDYGRYLGTRYRNFDNIVWMHGNDFQTWSNPGDDAVVQAVARGIHDTDDRHIHTVELDYPVSGSLDDPTWAPLIELNASYTYFPTYAQVLTDYNRPNALPTFLVEANYEFEHLCRPWHAAEPAPARVLEHAERCRRPALREQLDVAVHERLAKPPRHARLAADGERAVPLPVPALV